MDTISAFAMGQANRHRELMVFDWDKAAKLIRERKPETASAGLSSDWEWTGGEIYENGQIVESAYTYLASVWAKPLLEMDGEEMECYRMISASPNWDAHTKWPETAKAILNQE